MYNVNEKKGLAKSNLSNLYRRFNRLISQRVEIIVLDNVSKREGKMAFTALAFS